RVNEVKTGDKVDLVVLRKGKKVDVKGVELPEPAKQPVRPGIQPLPFPPLPLPGVLPELPDGRPNFPPLGADAPRANPAFPKPVAIPAGFTSVSSTSSDTGFTLKAAKGGVKYVVVGTF